MEYNPKYIYFEHADGLIDKWCIAADSICKIKETLATDDEFIKGQLVQIKTVDNDKGFPFSTTSENSYELCPFKFVYVDPAFQLIMREIYVGIDPQIGLTYSINSNKFKYVYYTTSSIEDAKEWVAKRRKFEAVMGAWEDGAVIEGKTPNIDWFTVHDPTWNPDVKFRVKHKVLEWTRLKLGDVITYTPNRDRYMMVTRIDKSSDTSEHIFAGSWLSNDDLADWEKVEE